MASYIISCHDSPVDMRNRVMSAVVNDWKFACTLMADCSCTVENS
jgi:hypothetical protein